MCSEPASSPGRRVQEWPLGVDSWLLSLWHVHRAGHSCLLDALPLKHTPLGAWSRVRDPENVQLGPPFAAAEAGALPI